MILTIYNGVYLKSDCRTSICVFNDALPNLQRYRPHFMFELGSQAWNFCWVVRSMLRGRFRIRPQLVLWPLNEQAPCASNIEHFLFSNFFEVVYFYRLIQLYDMLWNKIKELCINIKFLISINNIYDLFTKFIIILLY